MTPDLIVEVVNETLLLGLKLVGPILGAAMVAGLGIAVLQAATQVQESTLNFVPKLAAVGLALAAISPWAVDALVTFASSIIRDLPLLVPGGLP